MDAIGNGARAVALVGPAGGGKTSLAEALLHASGAIPRLGSVENATSVGDASPEARARGASTELNLMRFDYAGDSYAILDAPGSVAFASEADKALEIADLALVVVTPEPERAALAEPILRDLEARGVPHAIFVNKVEKSRGTIEQLLEALQPLSRAPLVARQIPIREGEQITGFVDLALDRAFHYRQGRPSERVELPADMSEVEKAARFHMLEQLADHDDALLEQLLLDQEPELTTIFGDLKRETAEGLVVPVMFGSAANGFGIRRLLKALRHDAPPPSVTGARLGLTVPAAEIFKICHDTSVGRLALARVFEATLSEGAELAGDPGITHRAGALFGVNGAATPRVKEAGPGEIVGIAKADSVKAGDRLGLTGVPPAPRAPRPLRTANFALALAVTDHKDEVRLSGALGKLTEEDPALSWETIDETHETLLRGINDEHVSLALDRLKRRYNMAVRTRAPAIGLRETVRRAATQRGRHKKQSGGHGQYGDCVIELRPLQRGEGFLFEDKITGGVIPRQWIPAVEAGIKDAMQKGPLGYRVVDVAVALVDGSFHSVDSSELAFRIAGRMAMSAALAAASPLLLEPIAHAIIETPGSATSKVTSALAARRARVLRIEPRAGWARWDTLAVEVPEAELPALQTDLRSLSQGMATLESRFDHLAEINGKVAEAIVQRAQEPA